MTAAPPRPLAVFIAALLLMTPLGADSAAQPTAARSEPVPICLSMFQLAPGQAGPDFVRAPVRVTVRYRAVSLSAATLEAMRTSPRAQAFYNGRVLRRLVQLATDVPLRIGRTRLQPGTYDAGFSCQGAARWRFLVLDRAGRPKLDAPLAFHRAEAEIPCLNLSLLPGKERGRLVLAARYGTLRGTVAMEVAGDTP